MLSLWTRELKISFHKTVFELAKTRQNPLPPINYRGQLHESDIGQLEHVLSLKDELQLADHIAFLAQVSEGFAPISAVCIEERQAGLKVVLARNELRDAHVLKGLRQVVQALGRCCQEGMRSRKLREQLFLEVLNLSERRIMERLSPPWYPAPRHWSAREKEKRTSLSHRIKTMILPRLRSPVYADVRLKLEDICDILNPINTPRQGRVLREYITTAVRMCATASRNGGQNSLESQLKKILNTLTEAGRKAIAQIDKIARYFHLCNDIAKLAKKSTYRTLFCNISLECLISPNPVRPLGAAESCFIHAEIQLILHYEQISVRPAPRVIGCSKSACFLCDRFIQEHGEYQISSAHRRIYPKWTIPDIDWMTTERTNVFHALLRKMTRDMRQMINRYTIDKRNVLSAPLESQACLPLSQVSTSSNSTAHMVAVETSIRTSAIRPQPLNLVFNEAEQDVNELFQNKATPVVKSSSRTSTIRPQPPDPSTNEEEQDKIEQFQDKPTTVVESSSRTSTIRPKSLDPSLNEEEQDKIEQSQDKPTTVVESSSRTSTVRPQRRDPSLTKLEQDTIEESQDKPTTIVESTLRSSQTTVSRMLPISSKLGACCLNKSFTIELLTIVFDFDCSSIWDISIRAIGDNSIESVGDTKSYSVESLSSNEAIPLIPRHTDACVFRLQIDGSQSLEIELRRNNSD